MIKKRSIEKNEKYSKSEGRVTFLSIDSLLVDGLTPGEAVAFSIAHSKRNESSGFAFSIGSAFIAFFPYDRCVFGVAADELDKIFCIRNNFTRLVDARCFLDSVVDNHLSAFSVFGDSVERTGFRGDEGLRLVEFARIKLELSEGGAFVGDAQIVQLGSGGFVLVCGVGLTAFSADSVVESFEFHDALDGAFAGTALNGDRFFGGLITWAEHVIRILVILEF